MHDSLTGPARPSLVGKLLVASTSMHDVVLSQSVAMVVEHHERQIAAVLLNRPISPQLVTPDGSRQDSSAHDQIGQRGGTARPSGRTGSGETAPQETLIAVALKTLGQVHFGGPSAAPMLALCAEPDQGEIQLCPGVYAATTRQALSEIAIDRPDLCRLIIGSLKWGPAELEQQLEAGLWHLVEPLPEAVWQQDSWMWQNLLPDAMSASIAQWVGLPQQMPDSHLN